MSEQSPVNTAENPDGVAPQDNSMAAFSPTMKELEDALNLLYIKNNASGRNKFRDKWPFVAHYLFQDELIDYDNNGVKDREHRAELEEKADERRLLLKTTIQEVVEKSVDAGMLNFDYVGKVIDTFGSELSKFLYAENIIERVRPGLIAKTEAAQQQATNQKAEEQQSTQTPQPEEQIQEQPHIPSQPTPQDDTQEDIDLRAREKEILRNQASISDDMDDIKPIDTAQAQGQTQQTEENQAAPQPASAPEESNDEFDIPNTLEQTPQPEAPEEKQPAQPQEQIQTPAQETQNQGTENTTEAVTAETAPSIDKTQGAEEQTQDPEMHIPESLSEQEPVQIQERETAPTEVAPAQTAPIEAQTPQPQSQPEAPTEQAPVKPQEQIQPPAQEQAQPHKPNIPKGQCTSLFNHLANKLAA